MKIAVISLSNEGARIAVRLAAAWDTCDLFLHSGVTLPACEAKTFDRIVDLTREIFNAYEGLVYAAPAGAVVRAIAPCLRHKTIDPAVVVVDVGGRWAVSLLSGHEGGATTWRWWWRISWGPSRSFRPPPRQSKTLSSAWAAGGAASASIVAAVREGLALAGCDLGRVRLLASADIKASEPGLLQAAKELGLPLRLIPADEIRHTSRTFAHSDFVQEKVDLPAVAEPAALLAGRRTQLLLPRQVFQGVTVAIAREQLE